MSYNITVTMNQLMVTDATESTPLVTIRKPTSGGSDVTVDTALSTSSYNAIANAPVATAINSVNASLTDVEDDVTALQSAVTALGNGQPTVVDSLADMTDTSALYIYDGDWYYYDGSAWVVGGTYGSGGINANARNLLQYILERAVYTETGMSVYITALINALSEGGGGGTTTYSITYALTNVTSSVNTASVGENDSFTCTLTADNNYTLGTVTVTMGGTDVTSSVYANGTVTIAAVTGNVVITATGTQSEWEVIRTLSSNDIMIGYSLTNSTPYYSAKTTRASYPYFDIPIVYGYIYKFDYETTLNASNIGLQFYNTYAAELAAEDGAYGAYSILDPGWQTNGAEYEVPEQINSYDIAGVRVTWRADTGSTVLSNGDITSCTISRKLVE